MIKSCMLKYVNILVKNNRHLLKVIVSVLTKISPHHLTNDFGRNTFDLERYQIYL